VFRKVTMYIWIVYKFCYDTMRLVYVKKFVFYFQLNQPTRFSNFSSLLFVV